MTGSGISARAKEGIAMFKTAPRPMELEDWREAHTGFYPHALQLEDCHLCNFRVPHTRSSVAISAARLIISFGEWLLFKFGG